MALGNPLHLRVAADDAAAAAAVVGPLGSAVGCTLRHALEEHVRRRRALGRAGVCSRWGVDVCGLGCDAGHEPVLRCLFVQSVRQGVVLPVRAEGVWGGVPTWQQVGCVGLKVPNARPHPRTASPPARSFASSKIAVQIEKY
jgi:hypothetical protein